MNQFRNKMSGQSSAQISQALVAWSRAMSGYRITDKEIISDDEVHLHLTAPPSAQGLHTGATIIRLKRISANARDGSG